jgi:hypothetical protein
MGVTPMPHRGVRGAARVYLVSGFGDIARPRYDASVVVPHWPDLGGWGDAALGRAVAPEWAVPRAPVPAPPRRVRRLQAVEGPCPDALPAGSRPAGGPLFVGGGSLTYVCAACDRVLCDGIHDGDLDGLLLRCTCGVVGRVSTSARAIPLPAAPVRPEVARMAAPLPPRVESVTATAVSTPTPTEIVTATASAASPSARTKPKAPARPRRPRRLKNPTAEQILPMPRATPQLVEEWQARLAHGDASVAQVLAPCLLAEVSELSRELASAQRELARLGLELTLSAAASARQLRDEIAQRAGVDRLGEGRARVPLQKRKRAGSEGAAGHEGDAGGELRSRQLDFLEKLDPVDVGHLQIEQQGVPGLARLDPPKRVRRRRESRDVVVPLEDAAVGSNQDLLVVDDEHAAAS